MGLGTLNRFIRYRFCMFLQQCEQWLDGPLTYYKCAVRK